MSAYKYQLNPCVFPSAFTLLKGMLNNLVHRGSMSSNISDQRDFSSMEKMRRLRKKGVGRFRIRRGKTIVGVKEMKMENLKLYLENRCIMEENKRLREKALVLRRENRALLSHISSSLTPHKELVSST